VLVVLHRHLHRAKTEGVHNIDAKPAPHRAGGGHVAFVDWWVPAALR
jgi:hypothetical protein